MLLFLVAVVVFMAAELVVGWWALPVAGAILGLLAARQRFVGLKVGAAALAAWIAWFAWTARAGELHGFLGMLAQAMQLPGPALGAVTLLLPLLLAGFAARFGAGLRPGADLDAGRARR